MGSALHSAVKELLIISPAQIAGSDYTLPDLLDAIGAELSIEEVVVSILQATGVKVSLATIRTWRNKT